MSVDVTRRKSLYGFEMRDTDDRRANGTGTGRKTHDIKQLWQRSHEILKLALLGYKAPQIAKLLEITPQTVSNTLNSELGMQKLSAMRLKRDEETVDVATEVAKLFPKAIKIYESLMEDEKASLSLKKEVADTVLMDIGGHRAPQKIQGQFAHAHLTRAELEGIKARGLEAARAAGLIADVTEVEVFPDGLEQD